MSISTLCKTIAARKTTLSFLSPRLFTAIILLGCIFATQSILAQVSVTATAGTTGPTSYTTLGAAFTAINGGTHQGAITINISANTAETAPAVLNSSGAGSAVYTSVLIQPSNDGVTVTGSSGTAIPTGRGLIELNGADNVTINGDNPNTSGTNQNLTITNNATNTVAFCSAIRVATSSGVTTADNITIRNCIINGNGTNGNVTPPVPFSAGNSFGIVAGGGANTTATNPPAALTSATTTTASGNTINAFVVTNCTINQCARGIAFNGTAANSSTSVSITNNVIGAAGTLSGSAPYMSPATTVYLKGVIIQGATTVTIQQNTIRNILSDSTIALSGIELLAAITNSTISNNNINGIVSNRPPTTTGAAKAILVTVSTASYTIASDTITNVQVIGSASAGAIEVAASTTGGGLIEKNYMTQIYANSNGGYAATGIYISAGNNVVIRNNMMSDLRASNDNSTTTTTFGIKGIRITTGTGHKIYYNSVNITGPNWLTSTSPTTGDNSACIQLSTTASTGCDIRNNLLSNTLNSPAATINGCVYLPGGATSSMNLTINNNAYYYATGNSSVGFSTTPNQYATLATFKAYTATLSAAGTNDNASYASNSASAPFTSATDLHVVYNATEATNNISNKGAAISGLTTDIDGETRPWTGATNSCIGADEFQYVVPAIPTISSFSPSPSLCSAGGQTVTITGTNFAVITSVKFNGVNAASFVNVSPTTITAVTPSGITAGTITVTNAGGTGTSSAYTITTSPTISSQPSATTINALASGTASFTVATGASSPTYQWQYSTSASGPWTNVANGTPVGITYTGNTAATLNLSSNNTANGGNANYYQAIVTSSGCDVTSNSAQLTIANYCTPAATTSTSTYLTNVTISGGITGFNNTSTSTVGGYTNYSATQSASQATGGSVNYSLSMVGGTAGLFIFVDWNQDGDFVDAGEFVYNSGAYKSDGTYTGSFTVPAGATAGTTRMRVITDFNRNGTTLPFDPCITGGSGRGETEDYAFTVVIPTCTVPVSSAATSITTGGATANWIGGTNTYIIEYGAAGFTPGTGATAGTGGTVITAGTGATSAAITGLSSGTTYQYYVRQVCSGPSYSSNSSAISFTTTCVAISSFPWTEGFEGVSPTGYGILPNCWSFSNPSGNGNPGTDNNTIASTTYAGAHSGAKYAITRYSDTAWFFTPQFQLTGGSTYIFSFWMMNKVANTPVIAMDVAYGTSNTPAAMTNVLQSNYQATNTTYQQFSYTITPASSGTYNFGIKSTSGSFSPWYLSFDDFNLSTLPNCSTTPTAGTAVVAPGTAVCVGTNTTLSVSGYTTGVGGIGIQWQSKPAGSGSFSNISGATSASYTEAPTAGTDYRAVVTCSYTSQSANSNTVTQLVNNPTITGTGGPTSICGPGTVTLTATTGTTTDTAYWYLDNTTTTNIGKGPSFVTPTINATTTFYVGAQSAGGGTVAGGKISTTGADGGFNIAGEGLVFNATSAFTLVSVDMYPQGASTVTIQVQNSSGTPIAGLSANYTFTGASSTPITVPLGFSIPVGTGYRLILSSLTGSVNFWRDLTASYPYAIGTVGSVTSGYISGTSGAYYFFYNLKASSGCAGTRTPVTVTYNTPPSLTVAPAGASICSGDSIAVVASGSSYPTLTWTPAGTVTPTTGANVVLKPSNSTDYVVTGTGAAGGCTNSFTVHIDVRSTPTKPNMIQHATTLCSGSSVKLKVAGVSLLDTLTTQDFNSGMNGWTVTNGATSPTASAWTRITSPYNFAGTSNPDFVNFGMTTPFTPYMHANADAGGTGSHTYTTLTSITFPSVGYSSMKLYYQLTFQIYLADSGLVQVSTDGVNWTTVKAYTATIPGNSGSTHPITQDSVDLSAYVGNANVQVRFYYESPWGYSFTLDNIFVTGMNTVPAYIWSPTTGLFNDAACTVPYTGTGRDSVYAKPTSTTTYRATVTSASTGCSNSDTVTISINNPATAVANASGNASITNAATYTLNGSATNYTSYTWSATGPGAFTNTNTLSPTYDPAVGQIGTVTVTLTVNALSPCTSPVVSTMVLTITPAPNNVWIGNTSDWFTVSNWASGVVPNSCAAIAIIPALSAGFVYPVINATSPQIGNITLNSGASITLNAGKTLGVCGSWTGGTTTTASVLGAGSVVFNGTTAQTMSGKTSFNTLNINKTAGTLTINGSQDVHTALVMTQGNVVNNPSTNSVVTLKSDASGTAYMDNFTSGTAGTWTGNLTVERYTGTNTSIGYRDLSSPCFNAHVVQWMDNFSVTGLDGVNCWYAYNPYPTLQYYNEAINNPTADYYGGFISTTDQANLLGNGKGYAARLYTLPSTINTTGTPNTGAISIGVTKTTSSIPSADGWNLLGNPYPSSLSWNAVKAANAGKTDGSVYRFTATGEYTGNYATWNGTVGTNGATDQIASTEGFWVLASATNTINFANNQRVAGTTAPFFKTNAAQSDEIRLVLANGYNSDEIVSYTDPNTTIGYEPGYDAAKMAAGSTVYMSFDMPAKEMAINVMDQVGILTELPLKIAVQDSGAYTLTATELNLTGLIAYLKDAENQTYTDLSAGPITLVLTPGHYYAGRYSVVFKTKTSTGPTGITAGNESSTKIYAYDGKVYVVRSSASSAVINISNLLGQQVADVKTSEEKTIIPMTVTEPWYALVKVTEGSKVTVEKVLISNK